MAGYGLTKLKRPQKGYWASGAKFTKMNRGESVKVRILAKTDEDFFTFSKHYSDKAKMSSICLEDDTCEMCSDGDYAKQRIAVNIYNHNTGQLEILEVPGSLQRDFLYLYEGDETFSKRLVRIKMASVQTENGMRTRYQMKTLDPSKLSDEEKAARKAKYDLEKIFLSGQEEEKPKPKAKVKPATKKKKEEEDEYLEPEDEDTEDESEDEDNDW